MRVTVSLFALLLSASPLFAQIKMEGPAVGTVGYRVKAKLTTDCADFQIKCFPPSDDWVGMTDFSGQKWIDFVPGRNILGGQAAGNSVAPKMFTFVAAGNKDGKTFLETWSVTISPDDYVPPPPPPNPTPEPTSQIYKDLKAAYLVSPNADAKTKLIAVYQGISNTTFKNFKEAADKLSADTPAAIGSDLRAVRDVVASYLVTNVGRDGTQWDQLRLQTALRQVIDVLKAL